MNDYLTIIFLIVFIGVCILILKYSYGDYDPVSIDKVDEFKINGETVMVTYKYTYKDGTVKLKTKKLKK